MLPAAAETQDVMQVCRSGHVITDVLRSNPATGRSHCDRCGATTIDHCPTCGRDLPGAPDVPVRPVGSRRPPVFCARCGAAFPWANEKRPAAGSQPLALLESLLLRVPRVIRQLRVRHGDRPAFGVADERDLEDLVRALLPIHFDDVRPECRTPSYSTCTRTDFLLAPEQIALAVKCAGPNVPGAELARQLAEDVDYYARQQACRTLAAFVYDPQGSLHYFTPPPVAGAAPEGPVAVRWVVGAP